jgi:hypothetical protein
MKMQDNEEKIISLLKNNRKSVQPSPVFKTKTLNLLLQEPQPVNTPLRIEIRVPALASSLLIIAAVLIVYGYIAASQV